MSAQKYGIQELKDLSSAIAHTSVAMDGVFEDGKVDLKDMARIPQMFSAVREFTDVEFSKLIPEAADVDQAEAAELAAHFKSVFNLKNDNIEEAVEAGFEMLARGIAAFQSLRALASQIKAKVAA